MAKAKAEKEAEEVEFATFKQFCSSTMKEKAHYIGKAKEKIEQLNADIDKATADAAVLVKEIGAIDADVAAWEMETKEKAHADFVSTHEEYPESIAATERSV